MTDEPKITIKKISAYLPYSDEMLAEAEQFREALHRALTDPGSLPKYLPCDTPVAKPPLYTRLLEAAGPRLRAVLELHRPEPSYMPWICTGCDFEGYDAEAPRWPCRTVELIADHLGVDTEEAG